MNITGKEHQIYFTKLVAGYEFEPAGFRLDSEKVKAYLDAVDDRSKIYEELNFVPPMAIAALAMAATSSRLTLPPGSIHVSQNMEFNNLAGIGEELTSYAVVSRILQRGRIHLITIGIKVMKQNKEIVLTGETCFMLPLPGVEVAK